MLMTAMVTLSHSAMPGFVDYSNSTIKIATDIVRHQASGVAFAKLNSVILKLLNY